MTTPASGTTCGHLFCLLTLLVASYAVCIAAFVLSGSLSRSSHWDRAMDGLFFSVFLATLPWTVVLAPLTGLVYYALCRRERLRVPVAFALSLVTAR